MLSFLNKKKYDSEEDPEGGSKRKVSHPQGVSASGNALKKLAVIALLITLVPTAAGFAYLILVREPALQERQIGRVSEAFASQQATNIHHLLNGLRQRIVGAAQSPLALSALASRSEQDISLVEQAMLDHFPEVISLNIIPIGEMGTAQLEAASQGLRNHIEVDLVRRTSTGDSTQPESYRFENRWLTSVANLIEHPRMPDRRAVMVVTLDNELLSTLLKSADASAGRFALEQLVPTAGPSEKTNVIAVAGSGSAKEYTRHAGIADTSWRVAFTPSTSLTSSLGMDPRPLYGILALVLVAAAIAFVTLVKLFSGKLEKQLDLVISEADSKVPLELAIPELVSIGRHLRRATYRALRQTGAGISAGPIPQPEVEDVGETADLVNPMFHADSILDEGEDEELDLDLSEDAVLESADASTAPGFPDHIFRAYDIRGKADEELTDEMVSRIGKAIGTLAEEAGEQTLIVGSDGRESSPRIKSALIRALMESGRDVIDIGMVPTPLLYFATRHLSCRSGVMVTGSHNPRHDNGLKIVLNQQTIAAGEIQRIRERVIEGDFSSGNGRMIREDIVEAYHEEVMSDIAVAVPLKVVIDAGNGATANVAPTLFEDLGCEVVPLYCEVDGRFPNHPPDTSNEDNLADLADSVRDHGADFGVAFDGDGDRLAVVTGSGRIIRSDKLLMIFAQDVVARNPGADVVFDVKCSRDLTRLITGHGGRPVLWKTGHAFMKEKMLETGALLGGEFSGHIFFGERWYGFDDGMYAAGRLAEILSTHGDSLDDVLDSFPASFSTPEILIPVPEGKKFALVERIIANSSFPSGKVNTLDGIRVDLAEGWGLVRASNTSAALTARFEANSEESLEAIKSEFRTRIAQAAPDIELNF